EWVYVVNALDGTVSVLDARTNTVGTTIALQLSGRTFAFARGYFVSGCMVDEDCDDGSLCTPIDTCNASHVCTHTIVVCDEGNVCNGTEICEPFSGTCVKGVGLDCDDGNLCTSDSCAEATGCQHVPLPDGASCSEGNACNALSCHDGRCELGETL